MEYKKRNVFLTRNVFRIASKNVMIRKCLCCSKRYTIPQFISDIKRPVYKKEMFWAFVSLKAYYKLAPLISSNKNFVSTIADSDIHAFIFYETENGIAGISIIITRHAKNNSCVYVTRELPGWSE